ncbi:FHA domain-containing protein [Anaeroselena agilis]|uniref:FHA domain-containing protein n=1 Tax=Anaeroselena agilis TaxID=3063788 RepID=A0ABU3P1W6_9FIRM|nr:FHA domain-containing protein [Selenomonadales bacterium 4137-cl]
MYLPGGLNPPFARLMVERGDPHERGACFPLEPDRVILGRSTASFCPDLAFASLLVSRRHCCLELRDGRWTVRDLGSRHGTTVNGRPLTQGPSVLTSGDRVGLAANVVLLRFSLAEEAEQTLTFGDTRPVNGPPRREQVVVDTTRKALIVAQAEVPLSVKEWRLLELLYEHRNELVPYAVIWPAVWGERALRNGIPDVGPDELSLLVYRLRRKLGACGDVLKTRRGQGIILTV